MPYPAGTGRRRSWRNRTLRGSMVSSMAFCTSSTAIGTMNHAQRRQHSNWTDLDYWWSSLLLDVMVRAVAGWYCATRFGHCAWTKAESTATKEKTVLRKGLMFGNLSEASGAELVSSSNGWCCFAFMNAWDECFIGSATRRSNCGQSSHLLYKH
jgi:hypothetical protein